MEIEPSKQTVWDWRAAVQFSCGGTGTGLLFLTALAALLEPAWLWRTGVLAMLFIAAGLLAVWIKLGRRWRAAFVILNPRTSWMTREAFLSLPLGLFGLAAILLRSPALGIVAALFGLAFLFAQARMIREAMGIPAWREPLSVPLLLLTGLTEGAGLLLAATFFFDPVGSWLPLFAFLLVVARLGVWWAYRSRLSAPRAAPIAAVDALSQAHLPLVLGGHLLPLLLLLVAFAAPAAGAVGLIAGLAALAGGWYLKATLITRAAYNQGFAITRTPARTPGYGGPGARPGWS